MRRASKEDTLSNKQKISIILAALASFILTNVGIFLFLQTFKVDLSVSGVIGIISGSITVWIIMGVSGILKEFSIKSPLFEMTSRLEEKIEDVKKETDRIQSNIHSLNNRIDSVITNQLTVSQNQSVAVYTGMQKEKGEIYKEFIDEIKPYLKPDTIELAKIIEPSKEKGESEKKIELPQNIIEKVDTLLARDNELQELMKKYFAGYDIDVEKEIKKANYYFTREKYDKVIAIMNRVLEEEPDNVGALDYKAMSYSKLKNYEMAYETVKKLLELKQGDSRLWYNAGVYLHSLKREADAIAHYEKALSINPNLGYAIYNLACSKSLMGEKNEALEHLRKAIEKDPKYKTMAKDDVDFVSIKDDPEFKKLIS